MLIRNGKILDGNILRDSVLSIKDGRIHAILPVDHQPAESDSNVVDAQGCWLLPGGIDLHAHIQDGAETFFEGSCAAAKGGITTVIDMPPFKTVTNQKQCVSRRDWAEQQCVCDFGLTGGILIDMEDLAHLDELKQFGISQVKIFMLSNPSDELLWKAMQLSVKLRIRLAIHMEDPALLRQVNWNDPIDFLKANPPEAEHVAVARLLEMAHAAGAAVHVCHVSSARSTDLIDSYKGWGTAVTAETTPHYLILNEDHFQADPQHCLVTPVLRTSWDNAILWQALQNGVLDAIVSDHFLGTLPEQPTPSHLKDIEPGIAGLELSIPLIYHFGVREGKLSMIRFVESMSTAPARLLGVDQRKGQLQPGMDADIVFLDLQKEWDVAPLGRSSRIPNLPYQGWHLQGYITRSLVRGKEVWNGKEITGEAGWGNYVPASSAD